MSTNITHEAVFPPAIHNIRRVVHPSAPSKAKRGSYELYDTQYKSQESPERIKISSIAGTAPGSPESFQEYNQVVEKLQQELQLSRRKESDLQQMLSELKNPASQMNKMYLDNSYLEESSSHENIGENIKDAHIRHLQRQVTVLQASLYKSDEWSNRVASAIKERDTAFEEVAHLTSRVRDMQDLNSQLLQKVESLSTALQAAHGSLHQATDHLHQNQYSNQLVTQLKDEIQRQGSEIKNLKDNKNRLDTENISLKDSSRETNSQSVNNLSCSQELEHLHKVVDRLKSTVLNQRSYLLQLRQTSNDTSEKPSPPGFMKADSLGDQESMQRRMSSSPKQRAAGTSSANSDAALGNTPHHAMFAHRNQSAVMRSKTVKENVESQQGHNRSSNDFVDDGGTGGRRMLKSHEILRESFNLDVLGSPNPLDVQGGAEIVTRSSPRMSNRLSYSQPAVSTQNNTLSFSQQAQGDVAGQNLGSVGEKPTNVYEFRNSQQHKMISQNKDNQMEMADHRLTLDVISQSKHGNKSDAPGRQVRQWNLSSANNSATLLSDETGHLAGDRRSPIHQGQRYKPPMQVQQETQIYETQLAPMKEFGQFVLDAGQMRQAQFGNLHRNPAASKHEQIHLPSSSYPNESDFIKNNDTIGAGKITFSPSPVRSSVSQGTGGSQQAIYINTSGEKGTASTASTFVDPSSRARPDPDRLCPVCNNNFSHVSMEEFQTHIFECFDDEHPPETMKNNEAPDRSCPMCNATFSHIVAQSEYEKHVHSHFGDEAPGANFEML